MAWMDSDERKSALKKLKLFSEKEMQLEHQEGIDFWFTASDVEAKRPPKWKMAVLTWVAVFPMVILLLEIYGRLFPSFSLTIKVFFVSITLVGLLTWVLMPNLTKLFKNGCSNQRNKKHKIRRYNIPPIKSKESLVIDFSSPHISSNPD